jgi:FkbM family methyltransferase
MGFLNKNAIHCIRGHHFDGSLLNSNSIILDLGGHKGEFSQILTENWQCTSYILEAMPDLAKAIIPNNRMHIFNYAIGNSCQEIEFFISDNPEANSVLPTAMHSGKRIKVPGITIAEFLRRQKINTVDFIKMDIEGAEISVFDSMSDDFLRSIKQITCEFHDFIPEMNLEQDVFRIKKRMFDLGFYCIVFSRKTHFDVLFLNKRYTSSYRALYIGQYIRYRDGIKRVLARKLGIGGQEQ